MRTWEKLFIYTFVILNSISGLQIAGVAINTLFVGVFVVFSAIEYLRYRSSSNLKIPKYSGFVFFLIFSIISCLMSMMYDFQIAHQSVVKSYLINSAIYLVIFVLFFNCKWQYVDECSGCYSDGIIYAARIQAVWGILQIVLQYGAGININQILFVDILHSSNSRDWVMGFFSGNSWNMRITGLNFENSMFALVVCLGAALEKKKVWKIILLTVAVLSLSRTGWIMVVGYLCIMVIRTIKKKSIVSKKKLIKGASGSVATIVISLIAYFKVPAIQRQVANILLRIRDTDAVSISGMRHLLYYPYGFEIWLTRSNILQMLFGYGMRCSGVAFSEQHDICNIIGIGTYSSAWAVECDVIGLLLGGGICTFLAYYIEMLKNLKTKYRDAIIVLLIGGITYHYHSISYVIFLIMMASLSRLKEKS